MHTVIDWVTIDVGVFYVGYLVLRAWEFNCKHLIWTSK